MYQSLRRPAVVAALAAATFVAGCSPRQADEGEEAPGGGTAGGAVTSTAAAPTPPPGALESAQAGNARMQEILRQKNAQAGAQ